MISETFRAVVADHIVFAGHIKNLSGFGCFQHLIQRVKFLRLGKMGKVARMQIIMDMIMPKKSGKAAYEAIKQIRPEAKALFSSGYSASLIQQQGELGINAEFVSKPVEPQHLFKMVREMLDR